MRGPRRIALADGYWVAVKTPQRPVFTHHDTPLTGRVHFKHLFKHLGRKAEVILTPTAQGVARGAAIFPELTARALHAFSVALPGPAGGAREIALGKELHPAIPARIFDRVTALGRSAARRLNEASGDP